MTADRVNADQLTGIPAVLARMDALLETMPPDLDTQRTFLATYRRTTVAVGEQVEQGRFEDPAWVGRWDVAFADLYVSALESRVAGREVPRPWRLVFAAPQDLPPLRRLLLGINAHITSKVGVDPVRRAREGLPVRPSSRWSKVSVGAPLSLHPELVDVIVVHD